MHSMQCHALFASALLDILDCESPATTRRNLKYRTLMICGLCFASGRSAETSLGDVRLCTAPEQQHARA